MTKRRRPVSVGALLVLLSSAPSFAGGYRDIYVHRSYVPDVAFVFARHDPRCQYPNGFNVTDFSRDINGTPRSGSELAALGCASPTPFWPY
jgi:hypothetical protein